MLAQYKPVVLVLGMPGSGKTTIGNALGNYLKLPFRSMGDILRQGRTKGLVPSGEDLATSFLLLELLANEGDFSNGFVLDFSPVTRQGEHQLEQILSQQRFAIAWVVYVRVNSRIAEERYVSRGFRPGDPAGSIRDFFQHRLAQEFWRFTLPMVRNAYRGKKLLVLNNRDNGPFLSKEIERISEIVASICVRRS